MGASLEFPKTGGMKGAAVFWNYDGEILEANPAVCRRWGEVIELDAIIDTVSGTALQT